MNVSAARHVKNSRVKRIIDITLLLLASPLLIPLFAATAVLVLVSMGKPVFFKQARAGLNEKPFILYKFRTMNRKRDRDQQLLSDSQRVTRVGRLMRKASLDELPQVINVLQGEMSLVGPRPLFVEYLPFYRGRERLRHCVRPGITGLAQTSGRNSLGWAERLSLDADYVENQSVALDLKIIANTVLKVAGSSGISAVASDSGERLDVLRSYPTYDGYTIRRFEFRDIPLRVQLFNDPNIRRYMTLPDGVTRESTESWLRDARKDPAKRDLSVVKSETDQVVALLGLRGRMPKNIPEMYILVDPSCQGRRVGKTALHLLLEWMRTQPQYAGCWLTVDAHNAAARTLYEKAGFRILDSDKRDRNRLEMQIVWDKVQHE